jgi:ATP-dependent Lon protease
MEVIELPGYTRREKLHIAMKYLVGRQLAENGLNVHQMQWTEGAVETIIDDYTREAGVRELERQIGSVCRSVAAGVAAGRVKPSAITPQVVVKALGIRRYESELAQRTSVPGVATGLAWTPAGGEIMFIEATAYPGKGSLMLTGQIGDVMKESVQAAFSLLKSRASRLHLDSELLARTDIHVHVPAGAVPKDGPSAGVAMFTALTSLLTDRVIRPDLAMTGEITLRGLVLPIAGVKEKVLAAKRAGIKMVLLPARNRKDISDVPADARKGLTFHFISHVDEALKAALGDRHTPAPPGGRGRSRKSR